MKGSLWTIVVASALLLASCRTSYLPNQPNVPLMSEGDEFHLGINAGSNGYVGQIAYSPYYHWAIAATGNTFSLYGDTISGSNYEFGFRHLYGEAVTGYYTRLDKYWRFELLGGIGRGHIGHPVAGREVFNKYIIQPSIGISAVNVDFGFTPRITFYDRVHVLRYSQKQDDPAKASFFEPVLTLRAGYQEFKFQVQAGLSIPLQNTSISRQSTFIGFGAHINLTKDFDKYTR